MMQRLAKRLRPFTVRMTDRERLDVSNAAKRAELSDSEFVRTAIARKLSDFPLGD